MLHLPHPKAMHAQPGMAHLTVLKPNQQVKWLDVLNHSVQYDFYHLPVYHALAEESGEGLAHLFLYEEGDYFVAIPLLLRPIGAVPCHTGLREEQWDAHCVYGYAGPVASHPDIPLPVRRNFWTRLWETLREQQVVTVFSRLHPLISQKALLSDVGEHIPKGQTVSIDLTLPVEIQRAGYRKGNKREINRLRRLGVTCLHDQDKKYLNEFVDIYHETMHRVQARGSYFFDRLYFERFFTGLGSQAHLFVCILDQTIISGGVFTLCHGIVQAHLSASRNQYYELSPNKLLIDTVRLWANEQGAHTFHLGGGVGAHDDSLFYFKAGFSKQRHDFTIWRWVLSVSNYNQLCAEKNAWCQQHGLDRLFSEYFPAYRCPDCPSCPNISSPDGLPDVAVEALAKLTE